jgi:hypothetical protein
MNRKKLFWLAFLALFAFVVIHKKYSSYHYYSSNKEEIILVEILMYYTSKDIKKVALDRLIWFEWNKICVYGPYGKNKYEWSENPNVWTIVFYLKDASELPMAIGRGIVEPQADQYNKCFNNNVYINFIKDESDVKKITFSE